MDLLLDGMIEREEFEAKKSKIREDQNDLEQQISSARSGDDAFKDAMLMILSIASEAYDLFKGSTVELKREMVNRVFANLELKGEELRYSLREPFDKMFNLTNRLEWQGQRDSNPRHRVLETRALPTELYPFRLIPLFYRITVKKSSKIRSGRWQLSIGVGHDAVQNSHILP